MWLGYDLKGANSQNTSYTRWYGVRLSVAGDYAGSKWYPTGEVIGDYYEALKSTNTSLTLASSLSGCVANCNVVYASASADCMTAYNQCIANATNGLWVCLAAAPIAGAAMGGTLGGTIGAVTGPGAAVTAALGAGAGAGFGIWVCHRDFEEAKEGCASILSSCLSGAMGVQNACVSACWETSSNGGG